jgi:hypothetical protein
MHETEMNIIQQNKLNMYTAVRAVLNSHETTWESLAAFVNGVEDFDEFIGKLQSLAQTQTSRSGVAADKAYTLHVLGDATYEVGAATRACAITGGNKELVGRVDISRSAVTSGRDPEIVARCQNIHAAASQYLDSLPDYGVNAGKLNALKKKIDAFQAAQPKPRQGRATTSAATKMLAVLFAQTDELLKKRLDGLAVQFKETQPDFYNAYRTARRIVNNPGGRVSKPANVTPAVTIIGTPVTLVKAA